MESTTERIRSMIALPFFNRGARRWGRRYSSRFLKTAVVFITLFAAAPAADAAEEEDTGSPPPKVEATPAPLSSPRATVETFLLAIQAEDFDKAARCLDLREFADRSEAQRAEKGAELAQLLDELLTQRLDKIKLDLISDEPDHETPFQLEKDSDVFTLVRGDDKRWRFSAETVKKIPDQIEETPDSQPEPDTDIPAHLGSARKTVETFLKAVNESNEDPARLNDAIECLDVSDLSSAIQNDQAELQRWARSLKEILDRTREIVLLEISDEPEGEPIDLRKGESIKGPVVVNRVADGRWLFSAKTVEQIPDLAEKLRGTEELKVEVEGVLTAEFWLADKIPNWLRPKWLGLAYWQWVGLALLVLLGLIVDQIVRWLLGVVLTRLLYRRDVQIDGQLRRQAVRPIGLFALGLVWWKTLGFLLLPTDVQGVLLIAVKVIVAGAAVWSVYRLIDLISDFLAAAAEKTDSKFDDLVVPLVRRALKVIVTIIGVVFLNHAFDLQMKAILTGLGIGGLALGFAARETLQNFFGSFVILFDRPFEIGDWIKVEDVEGTVESVGFRTCRVRTFYNSLITMPNSMLLTAKIDNLGARRYRRVTTKLSVTYDTPPEKIDAFCEGIRELIRLHPYTRKDYYHVYFNGYADSSLDVLLYCFHETPDWGTELRERHRLFNDILRLAERLGVQFAFPTQTIHLQSDASEPSPLDSPLTDPLAAGRSAAVQIVPSSDPSGPKPPPVEFQIDPAEDGGESDAGQAGGSSESH
jgi:MscS family membrane protein